MTTSDWSVILQFILIRTREITLKSHKINVDFTIQWTLSNPDPVSLNPRKSEVLAPSSRITFGMILGLKVTLCACTLNNYLRIRFQQL